MNSDRRYAQIEDSFIAEDLEQMKYARNYNIWLFSLLKPYLGKRILEIGPGIGNLTNYLLGNAEYVEGVEPNAKCAELLKDIFRGNTKFSLNSTRIEDCDTKSLHEKHFDTVICVNVLEHIQNDLEVLNQLKNIVAKDGNIVLLIPAIPNAYGPIDAAVGHFRRYTAKQIRVLTKKVGVDLIHIQYSNFIGLIGWMFNARIRKSIKQSNLQIKLFDIAVPIISRIEKIIIPPIGLSIIAIGKKV